MPDEGAPSKQGLAHRDAAVRAAGGSFSPEAVLHGLTKAKRKPAAASR